MNILFPDTKVVQNERNARFKTGTPSRSFPIMFLEELLLMSSPLNSCISFQNRYFMAAKFAIYLVINTLIFDIPGASHKVFWPFQFILNVNGSLRYWVYRST